MLLPLVICATAVFAICAIYFERRRRVLEAHMTKQVKERYAAYLELEERVRAALGEFERIEGTFELEIRKSREQIRHLEEALDAFEGVETSQGETPGGFLGVLDAGDASVQAQPVTLRVDGRDFEAELQEWERRVEATQHEKRNEIERQRAQIAELTERLRQLEPTGTAIRKRDEQLAQARTEITRYEKVFGGSPAGESGPAGMQGEFEQRIEAADRSARELAEGLESFLRTSAGGLSGLRETLVSFKPLLEEQARDRARAAELELQRQELEKSCATLEQRCGELDGRLNLSHEEVERAQAGVAELEARELESTRRLTSAREELASLQRDLETEREHAEREALAREELERAREEMVRSIAKLNGRLEEECTRSAGLGGELDGARARLEQLELQRAQLEAKSREQGEVLQAQTDMLGAREEEIGRLRTRVSALESKLLSTRESIGGQKSRLTELMDAIQVAQQEQDRHKQLLSDQTQHMAEARELLEQLRPVMESLAGELEKKQPAETPRD